ncbi:alkaline phosphatase family protein [Microbulbifer sp. YPW1]|uniref:alkaline phosphatase family protein n=1 Tax=Microbulbifer sp. YPW1 TaxID=2745199 RepID=UPI001597AD43|nr:alkaline phosphatase family protein [Microbulbifer sp. YPW1]QKX17108.1 alkaline phosphatase family protein [Microbulbifer sp. YPW1]
MTLIVIGLDSAEPSMVEEFIASGDMPVLKELRARGAYGRLENFSEFTAELPWTTFATGVMPEKTGYWTPIKYTADYQVRTRAAYEYEEFPAFFALGDKYRVCCFDIPQIRLQKGLNGIQVNAWGSHSPQVSAASSPPELYQEITDKYGVHPGLHADYAHALSMDEVKQVYDRLMDGIDRRACVGVELLKREPWDLFLTVFGETHGAGHNFWQFEPDHPLCDSNIPGKEGLPERPMKEILMAIDRAIGKIVDSAPEGATVLVFSAHGMGANTMDIPSTLFLPELMYRWHYGRPALASGLHSTELLLEQEWGTWTRHIWNTVEPGGWIRKLARKKLPSRLYRYWARYFEIDQPDFPMCPVKASERFSDIPSWMPSVWYRNCWPNMKGFALGSFSEGYIRVNVKGREVHGVVEPGDFQSVIDEIREVLGELRCVRTGEPMVAKTLQMREDPLDSNEKLSDADLVVTWQEKFASDCVEHPRFGTIGPVPHFRAGSHRHTGFYLAAGDQIAADAQVGEGHALDLPPSILQLLGAAIPEYMQGKVISALLQRKAASEAL